MAWIEGTTTSNRALSDFAKIFTMANRNESGVPIPGKNWEIIYPSPYISTNIEYDTLELDESGDLVANSYIASQTNWDPKISISIYKKEVGDGGSEQYILLPEFNEEEIQQYTINYEQGFVTFVSQLETGDNISYVINYNYLHSPALANSLQNVRAFGKIVLKTTTTAVEIPEEYQNQLIPDTNVTQESLTMFLEIERPEYLINPEDFNVVRYYGTTTEVPNDFHFNMRVFDKYDYKYDTPRADANISVVSKMSWYTDFKEVLRDTLDFDTDTTDYSQGVEFIPIKLAGITKQQGIQLQYWMNITNDNVAMVLMGDPTFNFDDYLISFAYIGRLNAFEDATGDAVPDVDGNFAITTSSSTVPCWANPNSLNNPPKVIGNPQREPVKGIPAEASEGSPLFMWKYKDPTGADKTIPLNVSSTNTVEFVHKVSYRVAYKNETSSTAACTPIDLSYTVVYPAQLKTESYESGRIIPNSGGNWTSDGQKTGVMGYPRPDVNYRQFTLEIRDIPKSAEKILIYSKRTIQTRINGTANAAQPSTEISNAKYTYATQDDWYLEKELTPSELDQGIYYRGSNDYSQNMDKKAPNNNWGVEAGVERDKITNTNNIIKINLPTSFGENTGTGVNDISMYKTRSGTYFQKHSASFVTQDEFMRKEVFSPSRWTNKFHLSPVYIVHSYDGYRGIMNNVLVAEAPSIVHLDDLVINKGTPEEESYKFFRINAPFSFLKSSPNSSVGIAIKKS